MSSSTLYPQVNSLPPSYQQATENNENDSLLKSSSSASPSSPSLSPSEDFPSAALSPSCEDGWWAAAFLLHLIIFISFGVFNFVTFKEKMFSQIKVERTDSTEGILQFTWNVNVMLIGIVSLSLLQSIGYLFLCKHFARKLIWVTLGLGFLLNVFIFILSLFSGEGFAMLISGLLVVFNLFYIYCVTDRIEFSSAILSIAILPIEMFPSAIGVAVLGIFFQFIWVATWILSVAAITFGLKNSENSNQSEGTNDIGIPILFVFFVSFFWTSQVIKNVVNVCVSGVVSSWYFFHGTMEFPSPTKASLKRALTTSFGSICLGSLIVAVVKSTRAVVQFAIDRMQSRDRENSAGNIAAVCFLVILRCLLDVLDSIMEYINSYAYAEVGIYGKNFMSAASDALSVLRGRGMDAVINDSLISGVITWGSLLSGVFVGGLSAMLCVVVFEGDPSVGGSSAWGFWAFIGFLIAFAFTLISMEVVESAVITLFVCLAEDPEALHRTKPSEYQRLVIPMQQRFPSIALGRRY